MSNVPGTLKRLRSERGVTQDQLAEAVRVSKSLIAAFENHRLVPQPDTARQMDEFFGSGEQVRQASAEAVEERRLKREQQAPWFKPWREIEELATTLRYFNNSLIPGLLQTPEYARSALDTGLRDQEEIERQLEIRMERQAKVLDRAGARRDASRPFWFLHPGDARGGHSGRVHGGSLRGAGFTDGGRVTGLDWTWQAVNAVALNVNQSRDLILKAVNAL